MLIRTAVALGLSLIATSATLAQTQNTPGHSGAHPPGHAAPAIAANVAAMPSVKAYVAANEAMHKDMAISYSGNSDVDFVRGMIPHHQGAIDMAKVVLEHGKDRSIRRLARGIIKSQQSEIARMKTWLAKNETK